MRKPEYDQFLNALTRTGSGLLPAPVLHPWARREYEAVRKVGVRRETHDDIATAWAHAGRR